MKTIIENDRKQQWKPTRANLQEVEEVAQGVRSSLGRGKIDPIDSFELAKLYGASIYSFGDFDGFSEAEINEIQKLDAKSWSGISNKLPNGSLLIILNDNQTLQRKNITILEELAHDYYEHSLTDMSASNGRSYDEFQEKMAYQTGAAILLPSKVISMKVFTKSDMNQVALEYGASIELVEMRIKMLGLWKPYISYREE